MDNANSLTVGTLLEFLAVLVMVFSALDRFEVNLFLVAFALPFALCLCYVLLVFSS